MIPVQIKQIDPELQMPSYAHDGDAGCDLYAAKSVTIQSLGRKTVPTGVAIAIPEGYAGFVLPRSGLAAKRGITVLNAPGLIDSGYRGEVQVILHNTNRSQPLRLKRGERIAQLVVQKVEQVAWEKVDDWEDTERGEGGLGSSGS